VLGGDSEHLGEVTFLIVLQAWYSVSEFLGVTNFTNRFSSCFLFLVEASGSMNGQYSVRIIVTYLYLERYCELGIFKVAYLFIVQNI
jgi:hypothetical protein